MRILVTGGLGFIGSHLVDRLVAAGHDVVVLDSLHPSAHAREPDYANSGAEYHRVDLRDEHAVGRLTRDVEAVSHQAARVGLGVDFGDVTGYVADNDVGSAVLLRALHANGFDGRLVLASSMVVYGEGAYDCPNHGRVMPAPREPDDLCGGRFEPPCPRCGVVLTPTIVTEDAPTDPRNVYAATKLHQEHLASAFARATGAQVVALRYHNVYGPRMPRDTPYAGVASIVRSACEAGRPPKVFEDGRQRRDFVHVDDVAVANQLALQAPGEVSGAYNVGSGRVTTILQMAEAVCSGFPAPGLRPRVTGEFRLGDVRHVTASTHRAATALGFRARVDPRDGLRAFASAPLRASVASP